MSLHSFREGEKYEGGAIRNGDEMNNIPVSNGQRDLGSHVITLELLVSNRLACFLKQEIKY